MNKYTLQDLVSRHHDLNSHITKAQAEAQVRAVLDTVKNVTDEADSQLTIRGFGKFTRSERAAYTGRNPLTGQPVEVPATQFLRFKVAK